MEEITLQKLKVLTGQYDPDMIYKLSLVKIDGKSSSFVAGLNAIPESLNQCPNLTVLDLSFNNLASVERLAPLKYLKTLILVSNKIDKLDSFKNLYALEQLYLQNNRVKFMSEITHLSGLPNLRVLSLQSLASENRNPVCENTPPTVYRDTILQKLPQLQVLDESRTTATAAEFYTAVQDTFDLEPEMLFLDRYSNWSKELPWKDQPIHVKVQLNSSEFKEKLVGCNDALMQADEVLRKTRDSISKQSEMLQDN